MNLKTHPVNIIDNIYKLIPLLILPLLRGFFSALRGGLYAWISGAWLDIFVLLLILEMSVLSYRSIKLEIQNDEISFSKGILKHQTVKIKRDRVCTVSLKKPWYYRPLKVAYLKIDTVAGDKKKSDIEIALKESDALTALSLFEKKENTDNSLLVEYSPRLSYIMLLCAILSNSFAGVAIAATAISQSGNILGEAIENRLFGTLTNLAKTLSFGIPPAAAVIGYVILFGWLVAFLINFLRHRNFTLRRHQNTLLIKTGTPTERLYSLKVHEINFITLRQSLATKLLRLYSVFAHCSGFGKKAEDISAIAPAVKKRDFDNTLKMILPEFNLSKITHRPNNWSIFKFVLDPLYPCALIPFITYILIKQFPLLSDFLGFVGLMAMIPSYWFLGVRIADFFTSGIGTDEKSVTVKYSKGFSLLTVIIPKEKITSVVFRQSLIQRTDNSCDVFIFTCGEDRTRHHIKNLNLDEVKGILK